jgi:hypothetical protein
MPKVDMAVLSKENSYSKAQAELIIKNFFAKNKSVGLSDHPPWQIARWCAVRYW